MLRVFYKKKLKNTIFLCLLCGLKENIFFFAMEVVPPVITVLQEDL